MREALLAAFGVAMIAGGEAFTFLAGLDAFLFWSAPDLLRLLLWAALGLSLLAAVATFRHIWRCERARQTAAPS